MNTLMPISTAQFRNNVSIRFNNILDGFDNYKNFEIKGENIEDGENAIISFLSKVFELNNNEAYVDLYLNNLDESDKENLLNICCQDDKEIILKHINLNHNEPYYKLTNKSLIPFLTRLNTGEVFFVTFYFTKVPLTIWGNYNRQFPCFTDTDENLNMYKELAKLHNLIKRLC